MSVSSNVRSELPANLPAEEAEARWPYTTVTLGATTTLSACRFVSRLAVNLYPAFCWLEFTESVILIKIRVPGRNRNSHCILPGSGKRGIAAEYEAALRAADEAGRSKPQPV